MSATSDFERRFQGECRADSIDGNKIRGTAIVFNSLSENLGGFREIIAPEAVDRTLREGIDVRALADHDSAKVLGRLRAGTLQLRKDSKGLNVVIEPEPEISYARDIMLAVKRGDISGMSFGFRALDDDWSEDPETGMPIRTVTDMRVAEVSVVSFPAYEATSVQVSQRSLDALREFQSRSKHNVEWLKKVHRTRLARS